MRKLVKRTTIFTLFLLILITPTIAQGQITSIDIGDGQIDPIWSSVPPILENNLGYDDEIGEVGLFGDIVSAWLVFDSPDPNNIFFRVDGYSLDSAVSINFDCDGDLAFTSEIDRSIFFETNEDFGDGILNGGIEGYVNYTEAYIEESEEEEDLLSLESVVGEYVVTIDEEDNEFVQIEAVFDLSGTKKFSGDMATCFGNRDVGNWAIAYQYDSDDEQTPITTQQVRTAVTLRDQGTITSNGVELIYLFLLILTPMTVSLLILRRKNKHLHL